jgi:hypothetical protein
MNTEATKAERERKVFKAFIQKSGLQISPESVESCEPPKLDIVCWQKNEGKVAFELVEICDEAIARVTSTIIGSDQAAYIRGSDPTWEVLRKKLKKRYQTEYPVELLCYTAGRTISPDDGVREKIRSMADMDNGQFRRIWLLVTQCQRDLVSLIWP